MSASKAIHVPRDWMRIECRAQVEALIRSSDAPNGHKRAAYLRWLIAVGAENPPGALNAVITSRPVAAPTAAELR